MKDTIELARAAGVHPLAMSEEYLPGLLRFAAAFREESAAHIYRLREEIMQQENEMYLMRQQNERLSLDGIHSCHAECQRPVCRLTRERDALLKALKGMLLHMGMDEDEWNRPTFDFARAAIAKAEGEQA